MPQSDKGWSCAKLSDEQATLVLEQMKTDLKPGNAKAAKVTGAMLLREFLMLRVAPLQARASAPTPTTPARQRALHEATHC